LGDGRKFTRGLEEATGTFVAVLCWVGKKKKRGAGQREIYATGQGIVNVYLPDGNGSQERGFGKPQSEKPAGETVIKGGGGKSSTITDFGDLRQCLKNPVCGTKTGRPVSRQDSAKRILSPHFGEEGGCL